ncbi:MAG TPA: chorismate mutase [Jiangellaceae bacterium]|nr:chorismate mutase [Jiangellaceae bacterium]
MTTPVEESSSVEHRSVRIGTQVIGGPSLPVIAGPRRGAELVQITLRRHHGTVNAAEALSQVRDLSAAPLLVEPFSAADLPAAREYADGLVVGGEWMQDFRLLTAVGAAGLPVVIHRGPHCTVGEWLSAVEYVRAGGTEEVVLAEGGSRRYGADQPALDLALIREVREQSGRPVIVDVSGTPWLAGAAVAAGADGLWLAEEATTSDVDAAREATTLLTPIVRQVRGDSLGVCREAIDRVDAVLASLLEYRVGLASEVQRHKPLGGHAGRNPGRETEIVRGMAARAPSLTRNQLATIMEAVIIAGLDAAEAAGSAGSPPVWRL